jgi:hypothetical protein
MLDFLEDYDTLYIGLIGFSIIFFIAVITQAIREIRIYVKKEKAISKIETRYDNMRQHRQNLIVKKIQKIPLRILASLLLGKGRRRYQDSREHQRPIDRMRRRSPTPQRKVR